MKIGILSDTHSKTTLAKKTIRHLIDEGAEFIIHAGDVCERKTLDELAECGKRYIAVYGNNDANLTKYHNIYNLVQEPHYFKFADIKFKLMHLPFYMSPDCDVLIFGHTHEFECEYKNSTLFLNPGETCARNKNISESAMLEVLEEDFRVTYYTRNIKNDKLNSKNFTFKRGRDG